jgi:adenosylmethionine-8-amino-7-oxononanoate aminotransferase
MSKLIFSYVLNRDVTDLRSISSYTKFGFIEQGKDLIDLGLGNCGCFLLGYGRTDIVDTVADKMKKLPTCTGEFRVVNEPVVELAERLYNMSNGYRSIFALSGSDALEGAIRVSHMYHVQLNQQRKHIIGFVGSYHGSTFMTSSVSGSSYITDYYGRHNFCHTVNYDLTELESKIQSLNNDVSCIVIESCSWQAGLHDLGAEFFTGLRQLCTKYNILLIVDDIAMCGGKTGSFFGFHKEAEPDIFCLGKGFTGGYYPLSACMVSPKVYKQTQHQMLMHGFTYSFSVSGIYSTLAYLDILEKENVLNNYNNMLKSSIAVFDNLKKSQLISGYKNYGLVFNLELNFSRSLNDQFEKVLYENGISAGMWNEGGSGLLITVPLNADEAYFNNLQERLTKSLNHTSTFTIANQI